MSLSWVLRYPEIKSDHNNDEVIKKAPVGIVYLNANINVIRALNRNQSHLIINLTRRFAV